MTTWIEKLGDEVADNWEDAKDGIGKVRRYFSDKIVGLKPRIGVDIDAALRVILDDSFLKVIDRIVFAFDQAIDKVGAEFKQLIKELFRELSNFAERLDETIDNLFRNITTALQDIKQYLIDPIVSAVSALERKLVEDINRLLDKVFNFFSGTVQEFKDDISRGTSLLIPNPFDFCRQATGTSLTPGPRLTPADVFNLYECNQLRRLEDSTTKVREIAETYASLQLQSFKVTCLGRGSPAFQDIYTKKWIKYGQLYDLWKVYDDDMTAQQAIDEAIRRLDLARNEYKSTPPPAIEKGDVTKGYYQTGHPLELGVPIERRSDQIRVDFPAGRFAKVPKVRVMLNQIDTDQAVNTRISVQVTSVTQSGFSIEVSTWADSKVYGVGVSWFAYAA
jgi:hypothetical protein